MKVDSDEHCQTELVILAAEILLWFTQFRTLEYLQILAWCHVFILSFDFVTNIRNPFNTHFMKYKSCVVLKDIVEVSLVHCLKT